MGDESDLEAALYDRVWSRVQQEINLIHQRLTWLFTLQGLLFTAYGFSLSAQATSLNATLHPPSTMISNRTDDVERQIFIARLVLGSVGILSASLTAVGASAARNAVAHLIASWNQRPENLRHKASLPPLGSRPRNTRTGLVTAYGLPFILMLLWPLLVIHWLPIVVAVISILATGIIVVQKNADANASLSETGKSS